MSEERPGYRKPYDQSQNPKLLRKEYLLEQVKRLMMMGIKNVSEIRLQLESMTYPVDQKRVKEPDSQEAPAEHIFVSTRTLQRYMEEIRRRMWLQIKSDQGMSQSVGQIAYALLNNFEEVSRQLWKQYYSPTRIKIECRSCKAEHEYVVSAASMVKVTALRELRVTQERNVEIMQSLGLVHKEAEKHQMLGADGKPVNPSTVNIAVLSQEFNAFIKAKHQDPVIAGKPVEDAKVPQVVILEKQPEKEIENNEHQLPQSS